MLDTPPEEKEPPSLAATKASSAGSLELKLPETYWLRLGLPALGNILFQTFSLSSPQSSSYSLLLWPTG